MIIVNNNWNFEVVARTDEVLRLYNKFLPAVCKYKNHTVYISEDVSSVELPKILLHELCHIVLYENEKSTTAKRKMDQFPAASQGCLYGSAARDTYRQLRSLDRELQRDFGVYR